MHLFLVLYWVSVQDRGFQSQLPSSVSVCVCNCHADLVMTVKTRNLNCNFNWLVFNINQYII